MSLTAITALIDKLPAVIQKGLPFLGKADVNPLDAMATALTKSSVKNLNRQAANSIAFYPMVVSNSLALDTIKVTAKHLEIKLADLIRIILTSDDVIDLTKDMTKTDVINMFKGATIGHGLNGKRFASTRGRSSAPMRESFPMSFGALMQYIDESEIKDIEAINCLVRNESGGICEIMSQNITSALNESILNEESDRKRSKLSRELDLQRAARRDFKSKSLEDAIERELNSISNKEDARKMLKKAQQLSKSAEQLGSVDVRKAEKANDMAPLILEVKVVYRTEAGLENTTIVMAVKVVTHLVPSHDMIREIGASMQQDRFMFRAVQWATGEIKFWRDLVLNINGMKKAASGNRYSHLFQSLKMNASQSAGNSALGGKSMLPTTTMVLTVDEVEEIEREFGVDLQLPSQADKFFNLFGLVGFIIIDETTESMHVYDEISQKFDFLSLPNEARNSKQNGDFMKVLAAMGTANR